jgi:cytochrome c peroxidase
LLALLLLSAAPAGGEELRQRAAALFGAVEAPTSQEMADPIAELGRALFWDTRLSADGATACASCHAAADWGSDRRPRSPDARGRLTKRHSQSVFNTQVAGAGLRWVGDRPSGAAQALGSITGSMGFEHREDLVPLLHQRGYAERFRAAFPGDDDPVSPEHYARALEAYQRTLRTPARFDRWLAGDDEALDAAQRRGLERFLGLGCASCHNGPLFGGQSLQRFGVTKDYWLRTGSTERDPGLMETSGLESDRNRFRVQPLRNAARTAPYFHDGSVADLGEAVSIMAELQLGMTLAPDDREAVLRFLDALTGEVPAHYAPPDVPER